jgi:signal transduction histidine kinase
VPEVLGNDSRLTQVFINLLLNAAQSLPPEEAAVKGNEVRVRTSTNASGAAVVSIEDTGCGIPPQNLSRIFDPFFTTRAVGEGAGLGLSIAHGIVNGLGGEIEVDSTVGKGTTVRVVLPSADEEEGRSDDDLAPES